MAPKPFERPGAAGGLDADGLLPGVLEAGPKLTEEAGLVRSRRHLFLGEDGEGERQCKERGDRSVS